MKKMIKAMCCAVEHDGNDIKPLSGINQISYRCSPRPLAAVIRLVSIKWKFTKKKSQWLYFRHHNDSSKVRFTALPVARTHFGFHTLQNEIKYAGINIAVGANFPDFESLSGALKKTGKRRIMFAIHKKF